MSTLSELVYGLWASAEIVGGVSPTFASNRGFTGPITRNGAGDYTLVLTNGLASFETVANAMAVSNSGNHIVGMEALTSTTLRVRAGTSIAGVFTAVDVNIWVNVQKISSQSSSSNSAGSFTGDVDIDGDLFVDGKLTVTGPIDPTDITIESGLSAAFQQWGPGSVAAVAPAGKGRIRFNEATNRFQISVNGGAWTDIPLSVVTNAGLGLYGSGLDGDVTDNAPRSLDRVYEYNNLTLNAALTPGKWPIIVKGTLTINVGGSIIEDGFDGTGQATGGAGGGTTGTGPLGAGANGGNGASGGGASGSPGASSTNNPRFIGTLGNGGAGGNSGAGAVGGAGGVATLAAINIGTPYVAGRSLGFFTYNIGTAPLGGGSGGGGGGGGVGVVGGKGGGGGGVIIIIAQNIVNNGSIHANGGNGFSGISGNGGGGGGGGGGKVVYVSRTFSGSVPVANGGNGGAGQGSGLPGVAGNAGQVVALEY